MVKASHFLFRERRKAERTPQAARVKIDEDGVEAAAYTEIVANDSAMMEIPPTVEMELDRPFLFVIFYYNNVPLFVGTVNTVA